MPKVSVIIPTYNRAEMVKEAISSVLAQTERHLEVIVVDDGSTDNTRSSVEGLSDERVIYFFKTNGGPASARNFGLSKSKGRYVAFLDHDDLWPAGYLSVMTDVLDSQPEYGLAYSPITVVYPDGHKEKSYKADKCRSGWVTEDLFRSGFVWTSAAVMRKSILEGFCYDESLRCSYEDGDFFLRLSMRTPFLFVNSVEAIRTEHTENLSSQVGILPARSLVLERFYYRLGGDRIIPVGTARKRISHSYRKVAKAYRSNNCRSAAITMYKRAIKYRPWDLRLYLGLVRTVFLNRKDDTMPGWQMPEPLTAIDESEKNLI